MFKKSWILTLLLTFGLLLVWVGERIVDGDPRVFFTGGGAALMLVAIALRGLRVNVATSGQIEKTLLGLHGLTFLGVGLYVWQSDLWAKVAGQTLETGWPKLAGIVAVLVPAVLALDAVRFSLDGADRRRRWAAVVAAGFAAAYRAAHAAGDIRLLAELIEVARANAVPAPMAAGAGPALDTVLDGAPAPVEPAGPAPVAALAGSAMLGNGEESRTLLGRPAHLRTPWGTVALAGPLDAARAYTDPLRAGVVVDWLIPSQVITALPAARPPGGSAPRGPG